jgi:V8-like Glu-specific endopeptidase
VASNDQKPALPRPHANAQRGQSKIEATIVVSSDIGIASNENAQIIVTHLPKAASKNVQQVTKTVMSPSTAVSQSTSSGAMTGVCACSMRFFCYQIIILMGCV